MTDDQSDRDDGEAVPSAPFGAEQARDLTTLLQVSNHFYRGEMDRITTWRGRMDQTTNWAVVVMAAILTWAFTSPDNPHYVILVGVLAMTVFLFIEAQRFREYDAWRDRIRVLQRNLYAEGYDPAGPESEDWRQWLSRNLRDPTIHLSLLYALGHRLQHVYLPLLTVMLAAWWFRVTVFLPGSRWREAAAVAHVPGVAVVAVVGAFHVGLAVLAGWSFRRSPRREF